VLKRKGSLLMLLRVKVVRVPSTEDLCSSVSGGIDK
jgi:hypothetical protein